MSVRAFVFWGRKILTRQRVGFQFLHSRALKHILRISGHIVKILSYFSNKLIESLTYLVENYEPTV